MAADEARSIINFNESFGPVGTFLFTEHYCIEKGCDCRRVILRVVHAETEKTVATINHSFEPPPPGDMDEDLGQTFLDPINPQSESSVHFMNVFLDIVLDATYAGRLVLTTTWSRRRSRTPTIRCTGKSPT